MDLDKVGFGLPFHGCPRGAVRLITDDQIKGGEPMVGLRLGNHLDRLVGGKDNLHLFRRGPRTPCRQFARIGVGRNDQIVDFDLCHIVGVRSPLANLRIRTHRKGQQIKGAVGGPLAHRLRHQRKRGHQNQHNAAPPRQFFGNLQTGEGLARAASHDHLAAIGGA